MSKSIAIIPGAFKPPHIGHLNMAKHYNSIADEVRIVISSPKSAKSKRFIGSKEVTPETSLSLWNVIIDEPGISVEISESPSPVSVAFEWAEGKHPESSSYDEVYLGASVKGNDIKRFKSALSYAEKSGVNLQDPASFAYAPDAIDRSYLDLLEQANLLESLPSHKKGIDSLNYHASDLRFLLSQFKDNTLHREILKHYVGSHLDEYIKLLNIESLELESYIKNYIGLLF